MTDLFAIRRANLEDAPGITAVKQGAWPGDSHDETQVAAALNEPDHAAFIAVLERSLQGGRVIGFCDGMLTLAADGARRWEVDLLAVLAEARGQGVGRALIAACVEAGRATGAGSIRSLIASENIASQRAFARCGFQSDGDPCRLYVCTDRQPDGGLDSPSVVPDGAYLIPVITCNYSGLWIEGALSAEAFRLARAICDRHNWDVAGAVIPAADRAAQEAAQFAGYALVGEYHWWRL